MYVKCYQGWIFSVNYFFFFIQGSSGEVGQWVFVWGELFYWIFGSSEVIEIGGREVGLERRFILVFIVQLDSSGLQDFMGQ